MAASARKKATAARDAKVAIKAKHKRLLLESSVRCRTERRAAACIQAAARATLARKTRAAARLQEVLRVKLAPLHAAATRVQAAARGLLARRWLALAVAAAELNLAAITIQRAALPFITRRLSAAIAQLRVRLRCGQLARTNRHPLTELAQRASGPTRVTEHTGKAAAGQMRGGKAATSAAGAKNRRDHDNDMMKYLASLNLRAGLAPATMALGAVLFPLVLPAAEFNGDQCEALELAIVRRMAGVEAESRELAWAVHNAVHAEYNYFIQEVRGFSQEEIICDTPDYFTGLARRLSDYLKNVEAHRRRARVADCPLRLPRLPRPDAGVGREPSAGERLLHLRRQARGDAAWHRPPAGARGGGAGHHDQLLAHRSRMAPLLARQEGRERDRLLVGHGRGVGSRRRLLGALWRACVL